MSNVAFAAKSSVLAALLALLSVLMPSAVLGARIGRMSTDSLVDSRRVDVSQDPSIFAPASDFVISSTPVTRTYDFVVTTAIGAPDGYIREMIVINGQYPGPLIEANEGDTIVVRVHNTMKNGTGLHWHGMLQFGTNWADGVPGVSQCPIPGESSFTYKFTVNNQYGTYWYHSHMGNTMADGLLGPLIIHSPSDPYSLGKDYDYERIIMLGDWMHDLSDLVISDLLGPNGYDGSTFAPPPASLLIDGVGVYNCSATTNPCFKRTIPDIDVLPNKRYRFRVINHSSHVHYKFSIDDHPLTVIAADGNPLKSVSGVHQLPIGVAQRYDVIVETNEGQNGDAFFVRAAMCAASIAGVPPGFDITARAALRYVARGSHPSKGAPTTSDWSDSTNNDRTCFDFPDSDLVPYYPVDPPTTVLDSVVLSSQAGTIANQDNILIPHFFWNSVAWSNYIFQPLFFTLRNGGSLNDSIITNHIFESNGGADIIVNNLDGFIDHPYHLHGNPFFIVARGAGILTPALYSNLTFSTNNPPQRDVIVIPRNGHAVLRLVTDNPGVWPLHCHIGWHLAIGKLAAIIVNPTSLVKQFVPSAATELCDPSNFPPGDTVNTIAPGKRAWEKSPVALVRRSVKKASRIFRN